MKKNAAMTAVKTLQSETASYRQEVNYKNLWIGPCKLYTGKFLTCGGATYKRYGMSILCRELHVAGDVFN